MWVPTWAWVGSGGCRAIMEGCTEEVAQPAESPDPAGAPRAGAVRTHLSVHSASIPKGGLELAIRGFIGKDEHRHVRTGVERKVPRGGLLPDSEDLASPARGAPTSCWVPRSREERTSGQRPRPPPCCWARDGRARHSLAQRRYHGLKCGWPQAPQALFPEDACPRSGLPSPPLRGWSGRAWGACLPLSKGQRDPRDPRPTHASVGPKALPGSRPRSQRCRGRGALQCLRRRSGAPEARAPRRHRGGGSLRGSGPRRPTDCS